MPPLITLILEGMIDGKQGDKLQQIIPLTNLNMVKSLSLSHLWLFLYNPFLFIDKSIMFYAG